MTRLDAALTRFSAALDSLEARVSACLTASAGADEVRGEIADLRAEREHLLARVAVLEEESASLAGLTEVVETRLDSAIAEIRAALDRG